MPAEPLAALQLPSPTERPIAERPSQPRQLQLAPIPTLAAPPPPPPELAIAKPPVLNLHAAPAAAAAPAAPAPAAPAAAAAPAAPAPAAPAAAACASACAGTSRTHALVEMINMAPDRFPAVYQHIGGGRAGRQTAGVRIE
jgi:hypothetical protein